MLSFRYPPHIFDKASSETLYSCKVSIKLVFDSSCFFPLPLVYLVKSSPPPTLVSLLVFLLQMNSLRNKAEELYIVLERGWKLRAVSDNWACLKRRANNRHRCGSRVSLWARWQTLSVADELCRGNRSMQTASLLRSGKRHACVYPIQPELTESDWPGHIHALYFLYTRQQCR